MVARLSNKIGLSGEVVLGRSPPQRYLTTSMQTNQSHRYFSVMAMRWRVILAANNEHLRTSGPERSNSRPGNELEESLPGHSSETHEHPRYTRNSVTFGTFNIRGRQTNNKKSKFKEVTTIMLLNNIDLLVVQESRLTQELTNEIRKELPGYHFITNGTRSTKEGITLIIKKQIGQRIRIAHTILIPGRASHFKVELKEQTINLVGVHFPNELEKKLEFTEKISKALDNLNTTQDLIILGDFNFVERNEDRLPARNDPYAIREQFTKLKTKVRVKDGWEQYNPDKADYTYHQEATGSKARIDRIYMPEALCERTSKWEILSSAGLSDHDIVTTSLEQKNCPEVGPGAFRIRLELLTNGEFIKETAKILKNTKTRMEQYKERMNEAATEEEIQETRKVLTPQSIWRETKAKITNKAKEIQKSNSRRKTEKLRNLMKEYKRKMEAQRKEKELTVRQIEELKNIKRKIDDIQRQKLETAQERARARYHLYGEQCTKYWFNLNKGNKAQSSINGLEDIEGNLKTESKEMCTIASNHHKKLQTAPESSEERVTATQRILRKTERRVNAEDRQILSKDINKEEIEQALKEAKNGSAPGKDGIPYELYKRYMKSNQKRGNEEDEQEEQEEQLDITDILLEVFKDIQEFGNQEKEFVEGKMFLLYKKKEKTKVENYRPITLLNTDYKILTKVLATRLGQTAKNLIHKNQTGFVPGRSLYDSTRLTQLIVHYCEQTEQNGCILSLDQEKAYDRIAHDYLWKVLENFRIPARFINLIKSLYEKAATIVQVNGFEGTPFPVNRGVRQGDPVSCLLYDLAIEPLACALRKSNLEGLAIPGLTDKILTQLFADDTTVILKEKDSFSELKKVLEPFCIASTAKFNLSKTEILPIGSPLFRRELIRKGYMGDDPMNTIEGATIIKESQPMRVLGCWIGNECEIEEQWETILKKQENILKQWSRTNLSLKGKEMIAKQLIQSRAIFLGTVNGIPKRIVKQMNKQIKDFVWDNKKRGLVNWKIGTEARRRGGMGIPDIEARIEAIHIAWLQKFLKDPEERPDWAYVADQLLNLNTTKEPQVDEKAKLNWALQTWQEKKIKTNLPQQLKDMIKVARKYKIGLDARRLSLETKRNLPIWHHLAVNSNYLWNKKQAKCLREKHNIRTVEDLEKLVNRRTVTRRCPNPKNCKNFGRILINLLSPKYDPREQSPQPEDPNENRRDEGNQAERIRIQNDIAERQHPNRAIRIFREGRSYKEATNKHIDNNQPAYPTVLTRPGLANIEIIEKSKKEEWIAALYSRNPRIPSKIIRLDKRQYNRQRFEIKIMEEALRNESREVTIDTSFSCAKLLNKHQEEWEDENYIDIQEKESWKALIYTIQKREAPTYVRIKKKKDLSDEGKEWLKRHKREARAPEEEQQIPNNFKLNGTRLRILNQKKAYEQILQHRKIDPSDRLHPIGQTLELAGRRMKENYSITYNKKEVWTAIYKPPFRNKQGDFLWKIMHQCLRIGPYFRNIPGWEEKAYCNCGELETTQHMLLDCRNLIKTQCWSIAEQTWKAITNAPWIKPSMDIIKTLGTFIYPAKLTKGTNSKPRTSLYKIFISETIYNIWLLRNKRVFSETDPSKKEITDFWNERLRTRVRTEFNAIKLLEYNKQKPSREKFVEEWCSEKETIRVVKDQIDLPF